MRRRVNGIVVRAVLPRAVVVILLVLTVSGQPAEPSSHPGASDSLGDVTIVPGGESLGAHEALAEGGSGALVEASASPRPPRRRLRQAHSLPDPECCPAKTQLVWEEISFVEWRVELSVASSNDGLVYATGGRYSSSAGQVDDDLWIHHVTTGSTSKGAPMLEARRNHSSAFAGGLLYVMGGETGSYTGGTLTFLDSVERYDPDADSWEQLAPLQQPRATAAACGYGGKVYVFGGHSQAQDSWFSSDGALDSIEIYDPGTGEWQSGPPLPKALDRAFAAVVNSSIWVVGKSGPEKYFYEFRPEEGTWRTFRYHFSREPETFSGIAAVGTAILVVSSNHPPNGIVDCWLLDTTNHALSRTTGARYPSYGISGVTSCGNTFLFAGGEKADSGRAVYPPAETAPTALSFVRSPSNARPGEVFAQQPVVEVLDTNGNRARGATGQISVSLEPGTGDPTATLSGGTTAAIVEGLAFFSDLRLDVAGSRYRLIADGPAVDPITSAAFDIRETQTGVPVRLSNAVNPVDEGEPLWEQYPAVATDGEAYLAAWHENYFLDPHLIDVNTYFSRVLPDGTVMEPSGTALETNGYLPSVVWAGDVYWVAQNRFAQYEDILGVRIAADGHVIDDVPLRLGSASYTFDTLMPPSLTFNGQRILAVWQRAGVGVLGSLFAPDGELIKDSFLLMPNCGNDPPFRCFQKVIALGSRFLVVGEGGLAVRVSDSGELLDDPPVDIAPDWAGFSTFAIGSNGLEGCFAYLDYSPDAFRGVRVSSSGVSDPLGMITGAAHYWRSDLQSAYTEDERRSALTWNGSQYTLFWSQSPFSATSHGIRACIFSPDLSTVLTAELSGAVCGSGLAAASATDSNALLAYTDEGATSQGFGYGIGKPGDTDGSYITYVMVTPDGFQQTGSTGAPGADGR